MTGNIHIEASRLALLWQLSARAREASNDAALAFTIVNETQALVPYRQAAWWRAGGALPGAVAAVSGLPQCDPGAPYVQWLNAVCRALARRQAPGHEAAQEQTPAPDAERVQPYAFTPADLSADLAADWAEWWPACALWLPLIDAPQQRLLGAVVFAREEPFTTNEVLLLAELAQVWLHAFRALEPHASPFARTFRALRKGNLRKRVLIALALACFAPVPLSVLAPAEVTAKDPFVVRSPLDGVIDRLDVQPNQRVEAGAALFSLDATTLASRNALARKNFDAAQEEYRQTAQLAVTDDKDRLDLALKKGKLDASAVELDYAAAQLARLRVTAARAGVAVFSDPNDWNGRAVSVGEKVMLLADPAHVELTAYLPVAENVEVKPGAMLTLYPKSSPLVSYDARIDTIAYRAEPTPDGVLAYRIKASFTGDAAHPVLGMMGTARIHGRWVPLAYYLLRRPLAAARQWLGW
jgi:hypothetical protein